MNTSGSERNRYPFTATQWQELEQQALIFKHMISGTPVPPDLIYSIKRSVDSSVSSRLYPHHPIGWGCFEMSFGRKIDPEPGRCRRTDGKKWRCSKEAYPDSKYCERHMHRGRNRSRKPVEVSSTTSITTKTSQAMSSYNNINLSSVSNPNTTSTSSLSFSPLPSSVASSESHPFSHTSQNSSFNPFFYTHSSSSSSKPPDFDFSPQNNTTHQLFLDSGSCSQDEKDFRHIHGMREGLDERAFFPEASKTSRSFPDSYQQLSMSSTRSFSMSSTRSFSNSQFQNNSASQTQQEQHCLVLGTDFKSPKPFRSEKETETSTIQRPLHHFFGDQWSPKSTDSWLDLAPNSRIPNDE